MTVHPDSAADPGEIRRLLAPLARAGSEIPSAEAVYWRARARLAIDEENRRRRTASRPLRRFQLAIGAGAMGLATLTSIWPLLVPAGPDAGLIAAPFLLLAATAGAYLLTESANAS